jgi:hypothetical protein
VRAPTCNAWSVAAIAVATALALPGCGPGVGGTGTGALVAFGATPASVCSSAIALELGCAQAPSPAPSSGTGSAMGTLPVQFVDAGGRITLDLNGNSATLASSCLHLRFVGDFGRAASGDAFFGSIQSDAASEALATLTAAPAADGGLTVDLRDADGKPVLGPVVLRRAAVALPAPNGC